MGTNGGWQLRGGWPLWWLAGRFGGWPAASNSVAGRPLQLPAGHFGCRPAASVAGRPLRWAAASFCFVCSYNSRSCLSGRPPRYHRDCRDFPARTCTVGLRVMFRLQLKKLFAALPLRPLAGCEPTFPVLPSVAVRFGSWPAASVASRFVCFILFCFVLFCFV